MKTYPVVEITFSPTGGTKKVADLISCYLGNITNTVNLIPVSYTHLSGAGSRHFLISRCSEIQNYRADLE